MIAFQEEISHKVSCSWSQIRATRSPESQAPSISPTRSKQRGQIQGRRRSTGDCVGRLSPIELRSPCSQDGSMKNGERGFAKSGNVGEARGCGGKTGGANTGRQLDSIVDEARAEVTSWFGVKLTRPLEIPYNIACGHYSPA